MRIWIWTADLCLNEGSFLRIHGALLFDIGEGIGKRSCRNGVVLSLNTGRGMGTGSLGGEPSLKLWLSEVEPQPSFDISTVLLMRCFNDVVLFRC